MSDMESKELMTSNKRRFGILILTLLVVVGGAAAYTTVFTAGSGTAYETGSGLVVETNTDHGLDGTNPFIDNETLYVDGVTLSSGGSGAVTVGQFRGARTNLSEIDATSTTITVDPDDKSAVDISGSVTALSWEDAALDGTEQLTYSASGSGTIVISGLPSDTSYAAVTAGGTVLTTGTTSPSGEATINVDSATSVDVTLLEPHSPTIDNSSLSPADGTELTSRQVDFSADIADEDFGNGGDSLTAEFVVNGSVVGTDTLSSNGTATYTYDAGAGAFDWYVRVSDQYGDDVDAVSETQSVQTPSTVYIRNVSDGSLVTDSGDVEARLFSGEEIFTKSVTNGELDLTGVPPDQGYILELRVENYTLRTVAIRSIYDQQTVYLLPESEDIVYNEFQLVDNTGEFNTGETILYIERPVNESGTIEWKTVTGDYFGSDGVFKTNLERDQRYRLIIENDDGDRRELGSYIAAVNSSATLEVGEIVWKAPEGDTYQWDAYIESTDEGDLLKVIYDDPQDQTSQLNVTVFERGNRSNVLFQTNQSGGVESFQRTEPLSTNESNTQWMVNLSVVRNGQYRTAQQPVTGLKGIDIPLDQRWATLGGFLIVVALGALFPSTMSRAGAVTAVAIATGLSWLGLVQIPMGVIGAAGAVALLGVVAQFNGGQI